MKKIIIITAVLIATATAPAVAGAQTFNSAQIQAFISAYTKLQAQKAVIAPQATTTKATTKATPKIDYDLEYVKAIYKNDKRIVWVDRSGAYIVLYGRTGQRVRTDTTQQGWKQSMELSATRLK